MSVPAADVETAGLDHVQSEQARTVQLLVEQVDVHEEALEVRIRAEGVENPERLQFEGFTVESRKQATTVSLPSATSLGSQPPSNGSPPLTASADIRGR